jgi:hypothetical protein
MQLIEMRRLQNRIPMARQIAIALVIRDDENHIRPFRRGGGGSKNANKSDNQREKNFFHKQCVRAVNGETVAASIIRGRGGSSVSV